VPLFRYLAVHIYGPVEFFEDADRLLDVVTRLTDLHEASHPQPWAVSDAPRDFIQAQLRGIVGVRLPITRIEAKRKMSQNRKAEDRANVKEGLSGSDNVRERQVAALILG
jgi:transcriptional regulator